MTTFRQIERNWTERTFGRLAKEILAGRTDVDAAFLPALTRSTAAAAAISLIRLDELGQAHRPLCSTLLRTILAMQQPEGGWGDVPTTVLAIKALRTAGGKGLAIARGLDFLASLQKECGAWPAEPVRRLPADASVTAMVLLHLSADHTFAALASLELAADWLERHTDELPASTRSLAERAIARCRRFAAENADSLYTKPRRAKVESTGAAETVERFEAMSWS